MSLNDVSEFIRLIPDSCSVMQIVCTDRNTFVLTTSGKIYSWGELTFCLGRKPQEEKDLARPMLLSKIENENIVGIATGTNHVLALTSTRKLFSWGENKYGQLGHGDSQNRIEPEEIKEIKDVIRISAGCEYSFVLVEKSEGNYVTYVWGNNNEIKLRKVNEEEQMKSLFPVKVLQPAWGTSNPQVSIKSNKRGKNYVYKSIVGNEVELGNLTKNDVDVIQTENAHLLRRFEILSLRAKEYEEKVYECDLSADVGGITEDPVLGNILKILNETNKEKDLNKKEIKKKEKELIGIEKKITEIESNLKESQTKEEASREEIEKIEDDIKYFDYDHDKNSAEDKKILTSFKNKLIAASEEFSKICDEKTKKQRQILEENDLASNIKEEINKLNEKVKESDRRAKIFTNVKAIRKEQLIYNFFEHSQKAVNREIDNMESIYETVKDSEIEALSKNLQKNNLNEYILSSLTALDQLIAEIEMMKKPEKKKEKKIEEPEMAEKDSSDESLEEDSEVRKEKKKNKEKKSKTEEVTKKPSLILSQDDERINFVYKKLNYIWTALEKYIIYTKEKNTLLYGLLQETVSNICGQDLGATGDEEEEIGDKRELMKKILSKTKLSKTMADIRQ